MPPGDVEELPLSLLIEHAEQARRVFDAMNKEKS